MIRCLQGQLHGCGFEVTISFRHFRKSLAGEKIATDGSLLQIRLVVLGANLS